ncbi:hypothetical protein F5Y03DRAFT_44413 [Xylaria venustula]|nr:hypothetical protein F5Y03DRAFT_44413 [Xylaria venustula]
MQSRDACLVGLVGLVAAPRVRLDDPLTEMTKGLLGYKRDMLLYTTRIWRITQTTLGPLIPPSHGYNGKTNPTQLAF